MLRRSGLGLILLAAFACGAEAAPRADIVGVFVWTDDSRLFGGLSGFDLADDGRGFVAVSDRGAVVAGRLIRDASGAVTGVEAAAPVPLLSREGKRLSREMADAEGLALMADGGFYVSFEIRPRVAHYSAHGVVPSREIWPRDFLKFEDNAGAEALAIDADGALYTLPERSASRTTPFPVYRMRGDVVDQPFDLRRDGDWLPTGADFGPDGRLYLLERDYWPILGFLSRVRRITLKGDEVIEDVVILQTRAGDHDNLESISVWRDENGILRLTLLSDDNFSPLEQTELVDFRIVE
ncbi:MAG: esterase-like activity of phytase family protein [Paracoccaceae bacterium]